MRRTKENYNLHDNGSLTVELEAILDHRVRQLRSRSIVEVLVKYSVEDATWVDLDVLHAEYPSFQL